MEIDKNQEENHKKLTNRKTTLFSTRLSTWANVVAKKLKPEIEKLTLTFFLKSSRPDKRLMVLLKKNLFYWIEHLFALKKKANKALPSKTLIKKVANINSVIAPILTPSINITHLDQNKENLASIFGLYRIKSNKKWTKYPVCSVSRWIRTLETLEDVISKIASEALGQSSNMWPNSAFWLVLQGVKRIEFVEMSMIFAVRLSNIKQIPKVIFFLCEMHMIVAFFA